MSRIWMAAGLAAVVAASATPAAAQVGATFVLRSGEKVVGSLVDMNARGLVATVAGAERAWPVSTVAVIDFVGGGKTFPAGEVNKVSAGNHVLALRDGSTIVGQLFDVGGRSPLRITFRTAGADRDFSSDAVARIYFAKPKALDSQAAAEALAPPPGRIRVPANGGWVNTGVMVTAGQTVSVDAAGQIRLSADATDLAGPGGSTKRRYAGGSPLPTAVAGALIGRIGTGQPFGIGDQRSFPAPASGLLFLAVNDNPVFDNSGEFGVNVTPVPYRRR
jgi:hypothetical protein